MLALTVAAGAFGAGWWIRGVENESEVDAKGSKGKKMIPQSAGWELKNVSIPALCRGKGKALHSLLRPTRQDPLPLRLSDHLLDESPLAMYAPSLEGPLDAASLTRPWEKALPHFRALKGYSKSFNNPSLEGGFGMRVFEFPSEKWALRGAAAAFHLFVCEYGADPFTVRGQKGIAVGILPTDQTIGWWVHHRRVVQTSYAMYGEPDTDRNRALNILEAAWEVR